MTATSAGCQHAVLSFPRTSTGTTAHWRSIGLTCPDWVVAPRHPDPKVKPSLYSARRRQHTHRIEGRVQGTVQVLHERHLQVLGRHVRVNRDGVKAAGAALQLLQIQRCPVPNLRFRRVILQSTWLSLVSPDSV